MENKKLTQITREVCVFFAVALFAYIVYRNYPLLGETTVLTGKDISELSPNDRVINFIKPPTQEGDLIYFNTKSEGYDSATVAFTFRASSPDQKISIGYKDRPEYHYNTKPVYLPFIEKLDWFSLGNTPPILYQKKPNFISTEQFFKNPPKNETVGTYVISGDDTINVLAGYTPAKKYTTINVPLRGTHTFYTYINNEPFDLTIEKSDLNWYEGEDKVKIDVYKNNILLTSKEIEDDGIIDSSKVIKESTSTQIKYEEGIPENGVYKIVINASGDSVIKSIKSSFSKIVFVPPIYPVNNSVEVYDIGVTDNKPLRVFTDSFNLNLITNHSPSIQEIDINGGKYSLPGLDVPLTLDTGVDRTEINAAKGDLKINGTGLFAFDKNQFFTPFIYRKHELKNTEDLSGIDYILTDYVKPKTFADGWKTQELKFNLKDAVYKKGNLSWIISAPNLKQSGARIQIQEIKVILHKDPIIKF